MAFLWVGLGGALGSMCRYFASGWISDRFGPSPLAIFIVNVTGAFLIGLITTVTQDRFLVSPDVRRFMTVGILGGYTTFSTFMYESLQLVEAGDYLRAGLNTIGSLVAGLIAVYLGTVIGRLI
jgi:fluoride exporter